MNQIFEGEKGEQIFLTRNMGNVGMYYSDRKYRQSLNHIKRCKFHNCLELVVECDNKGD